MKISSTAFSSGGSIPTKYTCDGSDINPPLTVSDIPEGAKSLALVVDDPDAPGGTWVHWVVFNTPVTEEISEDSVPGTQGYNDFGRVDYGGPCPPSGTHRYFFKVYALDTKLNLEEGVTKKTLLATMKGHVLEQAECIGLYER